MAGTRGTVFTFMLGPLIAFTQPCCRGRDYTFNVPILQMRKLRLLEKRNDLPRETQIISAELAFKPS